MTALDLGPILSAAGWTPSIISGIHGWQKDVELPDQPGRRRTRFVDLLANGWASVWGAGLPPYGLGELLPVERVPEFLRERGAL